MNSAPDHPNIVLVVMDTARAADVALGSERTPMPWLSSFAESGTRFTSTVANAPWTLPSHATLFSGEHPSVHGAHAARKRFDHEPTLPGLLGDAGYHTVGVSNNTWISGEFGFDRGFDEFLATWQLFQDGVDFGDIAQTRTGTLDRIRGIAEKFRGNPVKNLANLVYGQFFRKRHDDGAARTNEIVARNLGEWLDGAPLFLFLNYLEPHLEYRPPDEFAGRWLPDDVSLGEARQVNQDAWAYVTGEIEMSDRDFEILRGLYRAELAYLDTKLAELHRLFVDTGAAEETVFVVTGDHGENIGDHGLMDHQYSVHETLLRVPLVISGTDIARGVVGEQTQLADIPPTLLQLAGADEPPELPGESLLEPAELSSDRSLISEYLAPQPPIGTLEERYDCRRHVDRFDRRIRTIRRNGWKYVRASDGSEHLYELDGAAPEATDRSGTEPERRSELASELDDWLGTVPGITDESVAMGEATRDRLEDLGYLQ